ncbi:MAG: DUF1566 domain-containing protein [Rhodoferax sp.]|nr:DUF1566 domain-containing protein [Rhodoferax sp.]
MLSKSHPFAEVRLPCILIAAVLFTSQAFASGLNDTGITFCGDASTNTASCATVAKDGGTYPRQDARYGRDAQAAAGSLSKTGGGGKGFDFTKIANNGSVLSASAVLGNGPTDWACTRDNVTGLIWEVKTTSGLRSQSHTYTWYNRNSAINGGFVGTASGGTCFTSGHCDTEKFVQDVNAAGLCGASDWRMPSRKELTSILDLGRVNPAIDPDYFPNTPGSSFWSGSPYADNSRSAWGVDFDGGGAPNPIRGYGYAVRLVRGGQ